MGRLDDLLERIKRAKIAVIGDYCLDAYWDVDTFFSERSLETGLDTHPVRYQRYSPGGAGNVQANLVSLGAGEAHALGVVGDDPFGEYLHRALEKSGGRIEGLLTQERNRQTHVYAKPHLSGEERNRFDFGCFNQMDHETEQNLILELETLVDNVDLVVITQQLKKGIWTKRMKNQLRELIASHPNTPFLVDSRDYSDEFDGALRKLNDREALSCWAALTQRKIQDDRDGLEEVLSFLHQRWGTPVCLTRGERGALLMSDRGLQCVNGFQLSRPVDTVGAGDSMLAGMAAALSAGATFLEACELGNLCAAVTVQKIRQTGTAAPRAIVELQESGDVIYEPDLAEDRRRAEMVEHSDVEIIVEVGPGLNVRHAVFDHDGTVSTLREGWEQVMEPMMTRVVLGKQYNEVSKDTLEKIKFEVVEFIDRTTGLQTLSQMQGLIEMIRNNGFVDREDILDVYAYKNIYNDDLMRSIHTRLDSLKERRLGQSDLTLKGAPDFLQRLCDSGVRLYLVSGTDQKDVELEAHALGYGHLFENRIYGAVGNLQREAKREVLDRILGDIGHDRVHEIVTFGDGPVEIRESRKRGAFSVGVASDELRRHGWNDTKRARLIRAGAHVLIPDFADPNRLFELLTS